MPPFMSIEPEPTSRSPSRSSGRCSAWATTVSRWPSSSTRRRARCPRASRAGRARSPGVEQGGRSTVASSRQQRRRPRRRLLGRGDVSRRGRDGDQGLELALEAGGDLPALGDPRFLRTARIHRASLRQAAMATRMSEKPIVSTHDLCRTFGEGDATVRALDGVSVDFPEGRFTAIMGPSGSGKSTLMHCSPASTAPPRARSRSTASDWPTSTTRSSPSCGATRSASSFSSSTCCRSSAREENILLPLKLAGRDPDPDRLEPLDRRGRSRRPALPPPGRALGRPAAAGGDRPGAGSPRRPWSSPTSRPATSTRAPARRCWRCCAARSTSSARRW